MRVAPALLDAFAADLRHGSVDQKAAALLRDRQERMAMGADLDQADELWLAGYCTAFGDDPWPEYEWEWIHV